MIAEVSIDSLLT